MLGKRSLSFFLAITLVLGLALNLSPMEAAAADSVNLALNKPTTYSSNSDADHTGAAGVDGNMGTFWCASSGSFPQWMQVDLGVTYPLGMIKWISTNNDNSTYKYRLLASNDEQQWVTLVDQSTDGITTNGFITDAVSGSYRYVRLVITHINNAHYAAVMELEIYGTSVTASASSQAEGYEAAKAIDSNEATFWAADSAGFPQWLQIDMGVPTAVGSVKWLPNHTDNSTYQYLLEGSLDGSGWTTLADRRTSGVASSDYIRDAVTGTYRYVRLTLTSISNAHTAAVKEFRLMPALPAEHWVLNTGDTSVTLGVADNAPTIFRLINPDEQYNWALDPTPVTLLDRVGIGGLQVVPNWQYAGATVDSTDGTTVTLRFTNSAPYAMELYSVWHAGTGGGPVEHSMRIVNNTGGAITVYQQESLDISVRGDVNPVLWRIHKESYSPDASGIYKNEIMDGSDFTAFTNTNNDANSNGYIPIVYLDALGDHGLYVGWEWPDGRVRTTGSGRTPVDVRIRAGVNEDFRTDVEAGEEFVVPTAYLGAYKGDTDSGSNQFKRWFFENKAPDAMTQNPLEPLLQMDDQLLQKDHDIAAWGFNAVKWDYGWWPGSYLSDPSWMRTGEGDWRLGNPQFMAAVTAFGFDNLPDYTEYLDSIGLDFTLYLLLHDAGTAGDGNAFTSVGPDALPSGWFSNQRITTGNSADLGNEDCVEWLKDRLLSVFQTYNVKTYRSDFGPIITQSDKINRHKYGVDTSYWGAQGFYDILDHLSANIDGFRYEACGSGGSLKDYATLSRANVLQYNDTANYLDIRRTFYDSSYGIHPAQLMAPVNPDLFYGSPEEEHYGWRSVMLGVFNPGSPTGTFNLMPGSSEYFVQHYAGMYRDRLRPLVKNGDLYHILPRPDEVNWDGVQYYDPTVSSGTAGAAFIFKPTDAEGSVKQIRFKGLEAGAMYSLEFEDRPEQNATVTGAALMAGYDVTIEEDRGSEIIWIDRASQGG